MKAASPKGFYAKDFRRGESNDLGERREPGLQDEIDLLRVAMRRTVELAQGVTELPEMLQVLLALAAASGQLASLQRAHAQVRGGPQAEIAADYAQALTEVMAELGLQ